MEEEVTNTGGSIDIENNGGVLESQCPAPGETQSEHRVRPSVDAPVTAISAHQTGSRVVKYKKMTGQATMEGELFEVKMAALLFLRMKNRKDIESFQLACNVKGVGAMDDIVSRYRRLHETWHTVFIQLKHKKCKKLNDTSFTTSKDFSLQKYFEASSDIKKVMMEDGSGGLFDGSYGKCEFVLYTTAPVYEEIKSQYNTVEISDTKTLLNTGSGNELIFKLNREKDEVLYSSINGDEEAINKFLDALTVFSGQAIESDLDEIIQRELLVALKMTKSAVDLIYPYYRDIFSDWWRNRNYVLDENSDIMQKAVNTFKIKNLSREQEKESCMDLKFQDSCLLDIDTDAHIRMIHVVSDRWLTKVTCTKLNQTLQKANDVYTFLNLDSLLKETEPVMSAWSRGVKHLLVMVSNSTSEHEDLCNTLWKNVQNVKANSSIKKIVVVSSQGDPFTLKLKERFLEDCKEIRDHFNLTQLEPDVLATIKSRNCFFQEHMLTFDKLVNEEASLVPEVLNDEFIKNILANESLSFGPKLEEEISYYIHRTLERFDLLNQDILQTNKVGGIFVVWDITVQELQKLVPPGVKVGKVGDTKSDNCRFLAVESASAEDVSQLFETRPHVHEVSMRPDGFLKWKRTKGSVDYINRYVDKRQLTSYNPSTAIDLDGRVVLVEGQPGMGKSTIATHLAQATKKAHPNTWVIRVDLSKHTGLFDRLSCENGTTFLEAAVGIDKRSLTETALFHHSMEVVGNVVILLDGYDEISPQYTEKGGVLLTSFLKTKAKKIVITTRHSMREKLEIHLSTLAFTLLQFSKENQKEFFRKYWYKNEESSTLASDTVEELLTEVMKQIECSLNDKRNEFLGIPLHAMMLAEIYEDNLRNPGSEVIPDRLDILSLFTKVIGKKFQIYIRKKFPENKNIDHEIKELLKPLYKDHMNSALVLLLENSQLQRLNKSKKIIEKTKKFSKKIQDSNNKTGIVDRFSDDKPIFLHRTFAEFFAAKWFSTNFKENRDFLREHLFTDEFKVIRSIFDLMLSRKSKLHTAVINNAILDVKSCLESGSYLEINSRDKGSRSPLHLATALGFHCKDIGSLTNHLGSEHVAKLLLKHEADVNISDEVLEWSAIEYAMHTKSWDAVELILENNPKCNGSVLLEHIIDTQSVNVKYNEMRYLDSTLVHQAAAFGLVNLLRLFSSLSLDYLYQRDAKNATPLHEACIWNNVPVAKTLFGCIGSSVDAVKTYVNIRDKNHWSPLHYVAVSGQSLSDCRNSLISRIRDQFGESKRKQKLKVLEEQSKSEDKNTLSQKVGGTFLKGREEAYECKSMVEELIQLVVSKGGDIWAGDEKLHTTPLQLACVLGEVNVSRALIACLEDDHKSSIEDNDSHNDVNSMYRVNEVASSLDSSIPDAVTKYVNFQDLDGRCALHYACEGGSSAVVKLLIDKGGDIWSCDNTHSTPLHFASWLNNMSAVQTLIECFGDDYEALSRYINAQDSLQGWYPIHFASNGGCTELVRFLISKGADVWACTKSGFTPLVIAISASDPIDAPTESKVDVVRALVESLGKNKDDVARYINMMGVSGSTALHFCADIDGLAGRDIMEFLVSKGGDIWTRNETGCTPLHIASSGSKIRTVRFLVESLGDDKLAVRKFVNAPDNSGRSALHHAARDPMSGVIQYLITKGGDIWTRDNEGSSLYSLVELQDLISTGPFI